MVHPVSTSPALIDPARCGARPYGRDRADQPAARREPAAQQAVCYHPGLDNEELQAWSANRPNWGAAWRQRDFDYLTSDEFRAPLAKNDIKLISWREIGNRLRQSY